MILTNVTFSGVDETVSHAALREFSDRYPFVEWGVLISANWSSQGGKRRYPMLPFISEMQRGHAAHLCGQAARDTMNGNFTWPLFLEERGFGRIQLNGYSMVSDPSFADRVIGRLATAFPNIEFILQVSTRAALHRARMLRVTCHNVVALWDMSGGSGTEQNQHWPVQEGRLQIGYAGGIKLENVKDSLETIRNLNALPTWIDMESSLRGEGDTFDLVKCAAIAKIVQDYVEK